MNTEQVVEDSQAGTRPTPSADEVESMYLYIDLLRKQLAKAQSQSEKSSAAMHSDDGGVDFKALASLEKERDRYRAVSQWAPSRVVEWLIQRGGHNRPF